MLTRLPVSWYRHFLSAIAAAFAQLPRQIRRNPVRKQTEVWIFFFFFLNTQSNRRSGFFSLRSGRSVVSVELFA